jgi:hypothetical protein
LTQQHYGRNFSSKAAENYEKYFVPAIGVTCPTWLYHFLCLSDQPLKGLDRLWCRRPVA